MTVVVTLIRAPMPNRIYTGSPRAACIAAERDARAFFANGGMPRFEAGGNSAKEIEQALTYLGDLLWELQLDANEGTHARSDCPGRNRLKKVRGER